MAPIKRDGYKVKAPLTGCSLTSDKTRCHLPYSSHKLYIIIPFCNKRKAPLGKSLEHRGNNS